MIPLLFFAQGATAPVGGYGGITITQSGANWTSTAWYGGKAIKAFTYPAVRDAMENAFVVLKSYRAGLADVDPDN